MNFFRKVAGLSFAFLLMISPVALTSWSATSSLRPPTEPIPLTFFGLHIHRLDTTTPWPSISFGGWRLWDTYDQWQDLEPAKGQWKFERLNRFVAQAETAHVEVLLPLGLTAKWASARPEEHGEYGPGVAAGPKDMEDWRTYVRTVATHYKGRIHLYEIWNEPDVRTMFSGDVTTFVSLLREAYRILKEVDPHNLVVSPSMNASDPTSIKLFEQFLAHGGGNFVDAISYHFYPPQPKVPEQIPGIVKQVRDVMKAHGLAEKRIWDTETGWDIANHQPLTETNPRALRVLDDVESSAYVARAYVLTWASGVNRFYWYSWDHKFMGLVEPDGKTLKPAAKAYEVVEGWLVGAKMLSCESSGEGTWVAELSRQGNYRGWIVWNPTRTVNFTPPASWKLKRVRDLAGNTALLRPGSPSIPIGASPVLLESQAP